QPPGIKMNCDETRPLLEAYLDDELDLVHSLAIEQHVESCPECRRRREELKALRDLLRQKLPRPSAPPELRERVQAALRRESGHVASKVIPFPNRWLAAAALVAATLALLMLLRDNRPHADSLVADAVANHIRSLQPGHLTDVESTDRHTVKPWIAEHIDYSPPVLDFAEAGYSLAGARLDYMDDRAVTALVYNCRKHRINVFISPVANPEGERRATRDGFHVVVWCRAGMRYVFVSDLAEPELRAFSEMFRDGVKKVTAES